MKEKVLQEFREWLGSQSYSTTAYQKIGAVYVRVSTDKQDELSPISQLKKTWEWAQAHHIMINESSIFIEEEGVSGRKAEKREAFKEMMKIAKSSEKSFDTIIVWKYSRFARNQEQSIFYKSMLKRHNIDVVSISEPLVDGPFGSLMERIIEWMDEYYSINLSGEVMRGMAEKAEKGEPQTAPAFGYNIENNTYIPNVLEAPIVKFIFEKYASGEMEMLEIAKYLNQHHFVTKKGNSFENRSIWYILNNPVYCGKIRWTPNGKLTRQEIYENTKSIIKNAKHQPLISEDLFLKVQKRLLLQRKFITKHQRVSTTPWHWLKGLIRCGKCNKTFVRTSNQKKLRCNGYNKGSCVCSTTLDIYTVEKLILEQLKKDFHTNVQIHFMKNNIHSVEKNAELKILEKQMELSTQKLTRVKIAFESGVDSIEEYKENKKRINLEIENLVQTIETIKNAETKTPKIDFKKIDTIYNLLINDNIDMKFKYDIIHFLIHKIVYDENNNNLTLFYNE